MDEDRATVEDRMRRFGYSEKEARAAYHLSEAEDLLHDAFIEDVKSRGGGPGAAEMFWLSKYGLHFEALRGFLVKHSAQRAYPEGWGQRISSATGTESERDVEARREKMLELNRELGHARGRCAVCGVAVYGHGELGSRAGHKLRGRLP